MNERSIFLDALELTDPDERRKYLDQACGVDQELRSQVEELLVSHNDASSFLENPPAGLVATIAGGVEDTVGESFDGDSLEFLDPSDKPGCLGTISQYEVVEVVGRGGMGLVLRAYDTKLNRVVAIKAMAPELAGNPPAVKRFLREARAAAAVSHDHVVTIHAIEESNRPPFIVMEFVDGQSLQEKIDHSGGLELKEILRIGMQMARGLSAAHEQGLVHRDIKPANILLENGVERVKLTDFGLARAVDDVSVTQTGQIAGTPQFMSPEQANGQPIDARSDLFSLGSVLYTMCAGRPPFRAETAVAMLRRVTDDDPRSLCEVNSDTPEWLDAIIFKLLEKDPAERFQSAAEVAELLSQHLAHLQHPTTAPKPQSVTPKKPTQAQSFDLDEELGFIETAQRIYAVVALVWAIVAITFATVVFLFPGNYTASLFKLNAPWSLATGILSAITSSIAFAGTWHVRRRGSFRWAIRGNAVALLPVNPWLVFVVPCSVFSMIKLLQPDVRRAFTDERGSQKPPLRSAAERSKSRPVVETSLAVAGCFALVLGVVFYIQTDRGTVRIEVRDPDAKVVLHYDDGHQLIEIKDYNLTLRVPSGDSTLHIKHGDLEFETESFRIKRGQEIAVIVERVADRIQAMIGDNVIGQRTLPGLTKETGLPFVVHGNSTQNMQAYATLAGAASAAKSGDTIEVRGNGPFVTAPIVIGQRALTIRAGERFRPVIELSPDVKDATPLIETDAALVVEGLKLVRASVVEVDDKDRGYHMINSISAPLFVTNCEFANRFVSIRAWGSPICRIRNCMFLQSLVALSYTPPSGARLQMRNNVHRGEGLLHLHYSGGKEVNDVSIDIAHNTIVARPLWLFLHGVPSDYENTKPPIRIRFNDNVVDSEMAMIHFGRSGELLRDDDPLTAEEMELALKRTLAWNEGRNLYDLRRGYVETAFNSRSTTRAAFSIASNDHWQRFWGIDQNGALFGRANYSVVDVRKPSTAALQLHKPSDFRLESGPGSRAASDGHDLGIAANEVGPGDGYEHFRATDEYQRYRVFAKSVLPPLQLNVPPITEIGSLEGHTDIVGALDFLPDGKSLVSGSQDVLYHWDLATERVVRKIPVDSPVKGLAALPAGQHVITSHEDGAITMWNLADGLAVREFTGHTDEVHEITVSKDGKRLLSGGYDGLVRLWDIATGEPIRSFKENYCSAVALSHDGRMAAHGGYGTSLVVWDVETGDTLQRLKRISGSVNAVTFSPDGRFVLAGDYYGMIEIWQVATGRQMGRFKGHAATIKSLHFTPDGRYFVSSSFDRTILLFDRSKGQFVARAACDDHSTSFLALAPDGQSLASSGGYWLELKDQATWDFAVHKDREFPIRRWRLPDSVVQSDAKTNSLGMNLLPIPAGEFEMGTADEDVDALPPDDEWFFAEFVSDRREAETPRHKVTISKPFEMSEHEVTVGQFRQFIEATGYKTTAEQAGEGYGWRNGEWRDGAAFNWQNPGFEQTDEHPVCNVSWDDATEFCRWLSEQEGVTYRLPAEAEWEYACRAGTTTLFTTGDDSVTLQGAANLADRALRTEQPSVAWAVDWEDGFAATAPVGSFKPNAFGLFDMHGNAWEWCQDVYDDQWYETSPATDPVRLGSGRHVFRGGGFDNWPGFLRSADRYSSHSESIFTDWAGFRVVREVEATRP